MIHPATFIAPGARLIGRVSLGEGSSVWFGSILRADIAPITIGRFTNIQDGCVLHVSTNYPLVVGDYVSVGHRAVLHGCRIARGVLIGIGAVVLDGAEIGEGSIIGAGAVIPPGTKIPPRSLVLGVPGKIIRQVTPAEEEANRERAERYLKLWQEKYRSGELAPLRAEEEGEPCC
ncbi:MAG TPA: gamma carbonic anhydrase family protein [Firmicutes bacterium]|nr:gamma carbonic anhydrase family protein [Bacillota bacterium]